MSTRAGNHSSVARVAAMLSSLNPRATVIPTTRCQVELRDVLLTGRFDMQQVSAARALAVS
jgi:G3E family GTPase